MGIFVHNSCTCGLHGSVKKVILFAKLLDPLKWTFYQVFLLIFRASSKASKNHLVTNDTLMNKMNRKLFFILFQ